MGGKRGIRRVAALILVVGLAIAPAAWAERTPDTVNDERPSAGSLDDWVQSALAEVLSWFGVTSRELTEDFDSGDDGWFGLDSIGPGGGDTGTDAGSDPDPDG